MLSESAIKKINNFLENKIFQYKGPLFFHEAEPLIETSFDYKFKITETKKMISVGEWHDYYVIEIEIVNLNDQKFQVYYELSNGEILERNYFFKYHLIENVSQFLKNLDAVDGRRILISKLIVPEFKEKILNLEGRKLVEEQKSMREPVRFVVRDILNLLKKGKSGTFYLPEETDYSFESFNKDFSVELTLKKSNKFDKPKMTGYYVPEEQVLEVLIIFNPQNVEKMYYSIVGELNEILTHELTHLSQESKGTLPSKQNDSSSIEYYSQPHEIEAQVNGFKRLSKITKKPFEEVVKNWFETHFEQHQMNEKEYEEVIKKILKFKNDQRTNYKKM